MMMSRVRCSFGAASLRALGQLDVPGHGFNPSCYREPLLLESHNSPLAGHQGRERTAEMLGRDLWWPGLYKDVEQWCQLCQVCRNENGYSGTSAWASCTSGRFGCCSSTPSHATTMRVAVAPSSRVFAYPVGGVGWPRSSETVLSVLRTALCTR